MAEKKETPEYEKYRYGASARWFLSRGEAEAKYAAGALRVLAEKDGLNLGEEAEGYIEGAVASQEGITKATKIYSKKFDEKLDSKASNIPTHPWYAPALAGLKPETADRYKGFFSSLGDVSIKKFEEEAARSQIILNSPENLDLFTSEQRQKAQEVLNRYRNALIAKHTLDEYLMENLRDRAVEATRKSDLEDLAKKLSKV